MKRYIILIFYSLVNSMLSAQSQMRIHRKDGTHWDVPIEQIDSITFVGSDSIASAIELKGSWLWGNTEAGYYELLTFNEDKTYTGYNNYFTYNFDTMTYGWWGQMGAMLTLLSNGFGYQRRYNWYILGLSENALEVMTKMGLFTYYRLQQEVIHLNLNEVILCDNDDSFIFSDGVIVGTEKNKLYGISKGTTYILKEIAETNMIYAYKVIIE